MNAKAPTVVLNEKRATRCFYTLCGLHGFVWTLFPTFSRHNLPFDTIEGIAWGLQWSWGYRKHPPLAAWLTGIISFISDRIGWGDVLFYGLAQLAVVMSFLAVWRLARLWMTPLKALLSVALLEGIVYYNLITPKFNPTTLMTPIWAFVSFFFYQAIRKQRLGDWLWFGVLVALALLAKLQSVVLLLVFFIILVFTEEGRQSFRHGGMYLGLVAFLGLFAPHIYWSWLHDFPEIHYALNSTVGQLHRVYGGGVDHFWYPLKLGITQLISVGGFFILAIPLLVKQRWQPRWWKKSSLPPFEKTFLFAIALGPLCLTMLYALISGSYLYGKWCTPYFSWLGVLLMVYLPDRMAVWRVRWFFVAWIVVFSAIPVGRAVYLHASPRLSGHALHDAYFPGRVIANDLQQAWAARYNTPWRYVAGSHYLVANITAYAKAHPIPYFDWDRAQSLWIKEASLRKYGAVFVWWADKVSPLTLPATVLQRFSDIVWMEKKSFKKHANGVDEHVVLGVAFLPPEQF